MLPEASKYVELGSDILCPNLNDHLIHKFVYLIFGACLTPETLV